MTIEEEIFQRSHVDFKKLISYGFQYNQSIYTYVCSFFHNQFKAIITINKKGILKGKVFDLETEEEYNNICTDMNGEFVSKVRTSYQELLKDILKNCFIKNYFIFEQANRVAQYIGDKYHNEPEFLWESTPGVGVFRCSNNQKWYGIIMNINRAKLRDGEGIVEVINLKVDPMIISKLLNKKGFYKAYHMNKKSWISVLLDNTITDKELFTLIDQSYQNVSNPEEWIIPANPKYYDIVHCFEDNDVITWKQSSDIHVGDILYMYVAEPYSRILYKCVALEVNIPYDYQDQNLKINRVMKIQLLKKYTSTKYSFQYLNKIGIKAIRGPRKVGKDISSKLI